MSFTAVLLGPPGVGKGTQAVRLADVTDAEHLSTGDLLRAARRSDTRIGRLAARFMDAGELVPDEVVLGMVSERLADSGPSVAVIFDGFPRTVVQADGLDDVLDRTNRKLDRVVSLEADDQLLVERLSGRRSCHSCPEVFHVVANPPKKDGVCDRCGDALETRQDDLPETVTRRLEVYRHQTEPLIAHYRAHPAGLIPLDASQPVDRVTELLMAVFAPTGALHGDLQ